MTHTTKRKLLRDGISPDSGEPVKADKWRNLVFDKNGKSYFGCSTWESEDAAKLGTVGALQEIDKGANTLAVIGGPLKDPTGRWPSLLWFSDYSHTIQLPVWT